MKGKQKKHQNSNFSKEYDKIMKMDNTSVIVNRQWNSEGDRIQKFSLYEDYTPVKTSGSTTLNSEL